MTNLTSTQTSQGNQCGSNTPNTPPLGALSKRGAFFIPVYEREGKIISYFSTLNWSKIKISTQSLQIHSIFKCD